MIYHKIILIFYDGVKNHQASVLKKRVIGYVAIIWVFPFRK